MRLRTVSTLAVFAVVLLFDGDAGLRGERNRLPVRYRRLPARSRQPGRRHQPHRQRQHQLRRKADLVAGREEGRLRQRLHQIRARRKERLRDGTGGDGTGGQPRHPDHPLQLGRQGDRRSRLVAGWQPDRLHPRQQRRRRQRLGRQRRWDHDLPARDRWVRRQAAPELVPGQLEDRLRRRQKRAGTDLRRTLDRRHRPAAGRTASGTNRTGRPTARGSPSTGTTPAASATSTSTSSPPTAAARR